MSASDVTIRRIRPGEGDLLRDLRLRSLEDAPEAFGQSFDDAVVRTDAEWEAQARSASTGDRRAWFLAEAAGEAVGLVLARRRPPRDVLIFSMWVAPEHRRSSVGRGLIRSVERWARGWGARKMVLWVFAANDGAIHFYDRLGFRAEADGADAESGRAYGALAMSAGVGAVPGDSAAASTA